jgi:hypothetical protein
MREEPLKVLVGKPEGNRQLGRSRHMREDSILTELKTSGMVRYGPDSSVSA